MRVTLVGYGAVAAIHARKLREGGLALGAVCGPDAGKAEAFASTHGFECAVADVPSACAGADAAIIASPSAMHAEQARQVLSCGVPVLVELPACASVAEAEDLGRLADQAGVILQCAHTSRYAEPYRRLKQSIREKRFGEVAQLHYFRGVRLNARSWIDDALLHHAAHPIDLLLDWFGPMRPKTCVGWPKTGALRDVAVLATLPSGGPATIAVSHTTQVAAGRMTVWGERCTAATDGFGFIESDDAELTWRGDAQSIYEHAIGAQDMAFLGRCASGTGEILWAETVRLIAFLEEARELARTG